MEITYLGHSTFKLRGKSVSVITDPYPPTIGFKLPKHLTSDIVTISHDHSDHNALSEIEGNPFVARGPGEYEVNGVGIVGIAAYHDDSGGGKRGKNTIFRIEIEGISIVHLGDLGHELTNKDIDTLNGVDVLLIPTGGYYTLDAAKAARVVHEVDPYIVIPMHFGRTELDAKVFGELQPVSTFLKEMGKADLLPQPKLIVTKDKLPEELQIVVLG